jgi:hypothetical protein
MKFSKGIMAALLLGTSSALYAQGWFQNDDRHDNWDRHDNYNNSRKDNGEASENQKHACEPDVFRVCGRYIPNRDAITACLHHNVSRLNPDCRAVMEGRLK